MHPVRTQARALLIREAAIAVVHIRRNGREWFVLPGGGQDPGETLRATVARECREELGVEVEVGALRFVREYIPANHPPERRPFDVQCIDFVFTARLVDPGAAIRCGPGADDEALDVLWLPLARLPACNFYPAAIAAEIASAAVDDFPRYLGDVT